MAESVASDGRLLVGRYRFDRLLGHGGMGWVWAAHDETLGRDVAVKEVVPPPDLTPEQREQIRRRAMREARAAARIAHPSAVTVYDVVEEDGRPYIVMQLLPSRTLADILTDEGALPPARAARLGIDLVDALETAHRAGVLHRDVKPPNVMLTESGRAVLTDFGIATVEDDPTLTTTGMLVGSPAYMAPERARGEQPTPASDLWSLGATLFAAVEGQPPFRRDGQLPTLNAVINEPPPPAWHAGPLRPVIAAMLARDPAARPSALQARELLLRAAVQAEAETTDVLDADDTVADGGLDTEPDRIAPEQIAPDVDGAERAAQHGPPDDDELDRVDERGRPVSDVVPIAPPPKRSSPTPSPPPPPRSPVTSSPSPTLAQPAPGRSRGLLAVVFVVVLVLAAFGLIRLLGSGGAPGGSAASSTSTTGPAQTGGAAVAGSPGATSSGQPTQGARSVSSSGPASTGPGGARGGPGSETSAVPAGFRRYTDPTGFSLAIPSGWTVTRKGSDVTFHQPAGRAYLLVPQTTQPHPDSLLDWQEQERAASPHFPGYQRIRLERVPFHAGWDVADWEFRWTPSGGTLHVLDRNLRVSDRRAYALYWSVPEQDWGGMWHTFTVIADSFRPAT